MNLRPCPREKELADRLHRGHWPHACPSDLLEHVSGCRACSDLLAVTLAFRHARAQSSSVARLEPAGALWWRAQLRRRNAAIRTIRRPILGAQLFAFALAFLVGAIVLVSQAGQSRQWIAWLADLPNALHLSVLVPTSLPSLSGVLWLLVPILATLAVVGGVVVCLTSDRQ